MRYPLSIVHFALAVATATGAPNFEDHISPIFENSCTNCHNPDKQKGDLDLTSYSAMMRGGSGGRVAEPGEGADSKLYGVITHTLKPKMPPKGEKLDKKEADLIRAWIDSGLLENKSGKPKKKSRPSFALKAVPSAGRSEGPPPMPSHLLLEPVIETQRASAVTDMVVSPWAPLLAVTGQHQVLLYHTGTMELVGILPFDRGQPASLSFHPSGKYLLAGGGVGGESGTTVTWEIETGKQILTAGKDFDTVLAASLRADLGGVALGGPGKRVKLWDTGSDQPLVSIKKHTDWVTQLAYSPDGVLLASGGRGGDVYVWEGDTGNEFYNLRGHKASITSLAWRSDSNLLASASEDGSVLVWNMNNGKQVKKITAHGGGVLSLDWNSNGGGFMVTSGRDKKVKIWKPDFKLAKELPPFPTLVTEVAISQDGKRVFTADLAGGITVWDLTTGKQIGTLAANPPSIANRIKFIQVKMASLPTQVAEHQKSYQQAEVIWESAQKTLAKTQKSYRDTEVKQKQLIAQRTKLDTQLKAFSAQAKDLAKVRGQRLKNLQQARSNLNKHNAALAAIRKELQQAEGQLKKLVSEEKRLVAHERNVRKLAEAKPENAAAQQAAAKAKIDLENHRRKQVEQKSITQKRSTVLAQLVNQQKGPGNQLAEADKQWKEISNQWNALHAKCKPIQDQRTGLNQPISETYKQLAVSKKGIKPAREKFAKTEAAMKKTKVAFEAIQNRLTDQQKRLAHWQAAVINTEALHLTVKAKELTKNQDTAMDEFTALSKEIQQLKEPAALKKLSARLHELRKVIDQNAPALQSTQEAAKNRYQEYLKALSKN